MEILNCKRGQSFEEFWRVNGRGKEPDGSQEGWTDQEKSAVGWVFGINSKE